MKDYFLAEARPERRDLQHEELRRDYDSDDGGGAGGGQAGMQFNRHLGFRVKIWDNFRSGELLGPKFIFATGLVKFVTAAA